MKAATPHLGKFVRSLCWSPPGPGIARPHAQTIKPKLHKIGPLNRKRLALASQSVAQSSLPSPRPPATASPAALKSP